MRSETVTPRVLIADDQPDVLEALRLLLKSEGYRLESAGSPAAILDGGDGTDFDAILMDLNYTRDTTSGQEGLDLLTQLRRRDPALPVVVMTAWGSVDVAVDSRGGGARRPWRSPPCSAAPAISCRSHGRTRACSPSCARRSSSRARCASSSGS